MSSPLDQPRMVDRIVASDDAKKLFALSTMILSIPPLIDWVDGIVVFPGLGEDWRLQDGIRAWQAETSTARHLLITGFYEGEKSWEELSLERLSQPPYNLTKQEGVLTGIHAAHTKEQSDWVVDQVVEHKLSSLALVVSPYHLPRAYATLLKAFSRHSQPRIPIIPVAVRVSPSTVIPETGVDAWAMINGEAERIERYQTLGDVATYEELRDYIGWLWTQYPLQAINMDAQ